MNELRPQINARDAHAAGIPAPLRLLAARVLTAPVALVAVLAAALALRLFRLDALVSYYPDSYAQQRAAQNLLAADFPISFYYPPGIGIVLAPFFLVLPDSLATMQAVVMLAGVALVALSYVMMSAATGDRRSGLFLAVAVAVGSPFVFYSRVLFFDAINTLLIAGALVLAPAVARAHAARTHPGVARSWRGIAIPAVYGALVFVMVTVRYTNVVVLPALLLASLATTNDRPHAAGANSWGAYCRALRAQALSRPVVIALSVVVALYTAYLATSHATLNRFGGDENKSGSVVDFGSYFPRLGKYGISTLVGYADPFTFEDALAAVAVGALAAIGARHLWRTDRRVLLPALYIIAVWSPVHAVYEVFTNRYAMPPHLFVLAFAAVGLAVSIDWTRSRPAHVQRVVCTAVVSLAITTVVARQAAVDYIFLQNWPEQQSARSRERSYGILRDALAGIEAPSAEGGLLLSSQALAVDRANAAITTYDLLRHSETYGINDDSTRRMLAMVDAQLAAGGTVIYHYTEFEDERSRFRKYEQSFDAYYEALRARYMLREIASAPDRPQRLYMVEAIRP